MHGTLKKRELILLTNGFQLLTNHYGWQVDSLQSDIRNFGKYMKNEVLALYISASSHLIT